MSTDPKNDGSLLRNALEAAVQALTSAQQAAVHGDFQQCYNRIRMALTYLEDIKEKLPREADRRTR